MVVVFGGIKGGTGKSTLAVTMAVWLGQRRKDVMLYDGDPQQTAYNFVQFRTMQPDKPTPGFGYSRLAMFPLNHHVQVLRYYDFIVDVGGRDTTVQREALTLADVLVVPLALSGFDVWPLEELLDLVKQAREYNPKLAVFLVANRCDYRGANTAAYREVAELLDSMGLRFQGLVTNRVVYSRTTALGQSVFDNDLPPTLVDEKAQAELAKLFEDILATPPHEAAA